MSATIRRFGVVGLFGLLGWASALSASLPLTFEERVKAQEAIERVYYSHRIWPKENPEPKPPFEEVLPPSAIEAKVRDYLKKEAALDHLWGRPITGDMLQAELNRIVRGSRDTGTLTELFVALDYDPYRIAECLAKPILVDRLARNAFANDAGIHAATQRAAHAAFDRLSRTASEFSDPMANARGRIRYVLEGQGRAGESSPGQGDDLHVIPVGPAELHGLIEDAPPVGEVSLLDRRETFVLARTLSSDAVHLESEWLIFPKVSFDAWWARESSRLIAPHRSGSAGRTDYILLETMRRMEAACSDVWLNSNLDDVPDPRFGHTAVWTGAEMIVWGGGPNYYRTGGHYNPATDTWTPTGTGNGCPTGRQFHTAVWTGTRMIVWGGYDGTTSTSFLGTGGIYDPATGSWAATSGTGAPTARQRHTALWTGTEMIIWGGYGCTDPSTPTNCVNTLSYFADGGRFTPDGAGGTWAGTTTVDAPAGRIYHTAVWAEGAGKMIVWGGYNGTTQLNSGGEYDPVANAWEATGTGANLPTARQEHTAVWTGTRMIVWGGEGSTKVNTGGSYDPSGNGWTATSTGSPCPTARKLHSAVWTGDRMIVWGGNDQLTGNPVQSGGLYDPVSDGWTATGTGTNCPSARQEHTAVWATWGSPATSRMIVWGGYKTTSSGGMYDAALDTWVPTSIGASVPIARSYHTAIWTGAEMIVWGGENLPLVQENSGGRYDFATATWTPTDTGTNCPRSRRYHTAVWTGTEMLVWGGSWFDGTNHFLNDGGKYRPASNAWATMATPSLTARHRHSAIWNGAEMWVWGGQITGGDTGTYTNTGGRYAPGTDSWGTMTTTSAPAVRRDHTAVWTGSQMVVWGGRDNGPLAGGGKYSTDTWATLSGGPTARYGHSAFWAPEISEMVVWGGENATVVLRDGSRWKPAKTVTLGDALDDYPVTWSAEGWTAIGGGTTPAPPATPPSSFSARRNHTALWTGQEMLAWGGVYTEGETYLLKDDGCRYNPYSTWVPSTKTYTPSWTLMTPGNYTPPPRVMHTAIWSPPLETSPWWGTRMIVWGGEGPMSSGGVYEPPPPIIGAYEGNGTGPVTLTTAFYPPRVLPLKTYQWLLCGAEIPGATDRTYAVSQADPTMDWQADYNVTVTLEDGSTCEGVPHHVSLWALPTPTINRGYTYTWNFGDGGSSTLQNPLHAYSCPGTYTWSMTAAAISPNPAVTCASKTGTVTITSDCSLPCTATVPFIGDAGVALDFQATATPANCTGTPAYSWDFGDGNTSTLQNDSHSYAAPGTFTWILTVTVDDGMCTQSGAVVIGDTCASTCIYTAPATGSVGAPLSFYATALPATCPSGWNGSGGAGSLGTLENPALGCVAPGLVLKCDQTYKGYLWMRDGVTISPLATAQTYTAKESGIYTVQVVDSHGGIGTSDPYYVTIFPNPVPVIDGVIQASCMTRLTTTEEFVSYQWKLGSTAIPGATDRVYYAPANGSYNVTVTDSNGCEGTSATAWVVTNYPVPEITMSPSTGRACIDMTPGVTEVTLTATCNTCENPPITGYQWLLDGQPIPGATGADYQFDAPAPGIYKFKVQVIDSLGCSGTSPLEKTVTIYALPTPTIDGPTFEVCIANLSTTLTYTAYQWYLDGVAIGGATARNYITQVSGSYTVTVTDSNGCVGTSPPFVVDIFETVQPVITGPSHGCSAPGVTLSTGEYIAYQWYLDGVAIEGATDRTYATVETGFHLYTVQVEDTHACTPTSRGLWVNLDPPRPQITVAEERFWVPNAAVHAVAEYGDKLYLGGEFTHVGPLTGSGVILDATTGVRDGTWPRVDGQVYAIRPDGSGGWFLGGLFTRVGEYARQNLAHLKSDKSVDSAFAPGMNDAVYALAVNGNTLFVGGAFTQVNGQAIKYLASLDVPSGQLLSWNPQITTAVAPFIGALEYSGTTLFAGGNFTVLKADGINVTRNRLASFDFSAGHSGELTDWNPNMGASVLALALSGTTLYAGGDFTTVGGTTGRNRLAAFDLANAGAYITTWNPNAGADVRAIAVSGATVYVGGDFVLINTVTKNHVAALNDVTDTTSPWVTSWNPNLGTTTGNTVNTLAVSADGTTVYAGGLFSWVGSAATVRTNLAKIDAATGTAMAWDPITSSNVRAMALYGTNLAVGGDFASVGGVLRRGLAELDMDTGEATAWKADLGGTGTPLSVYTLLATGTTLYAGGAFTTLTTEAGASTRNRLASLDLTAGTLNGWNPNASAIVRCLAASADTLFVGGDFTTLGGTGRNRLGSYDLAGGTLSTWNPNAGGVVRSLSLSGTALYAGGDFTTMGGQARNRLAAFDLASAGALAGWNPSSNSVVRALVATPSAVYAGGDFSTSIGGAARNHLAALDPATGLALAWNPGTNGTTNAVNSLLLSSSGATMYAGGAFTTVGGTTRNHLAAIEADPAGAGALVGTWNPDAGSTTGNTVNCFFARGGVILAGGKFTSLRGLARPFLGSAPLLIAPCGTTLSFQTDLSSTYQWMRGGGDISGATSQAYTASVSGSYSVRVTDSRGCAGTSSEYMLTLPSCGAPEVSPAGSAFPARLLLSSGVYTLKFSKVETATSYNIYEGTIGSYDPYSHGGNPGEGFACAATVTDLGTGEMEATIVPSAGNHYYLVTAVAGGAEGPSGYDSQGQPIDATKSTCDP